MQMPLNVSKLSMSLFELIVVLMYNRISDAMDENEARKELFTQKSRSLENILPTKAELEQCIKRVRYRANVWNNALVSDPELPSPF